MGSTDVTSQKRTKAALWFWVLLVVICVVAAWFAFRSAPEAKVTLLPDGASLKSELPLPDRWIPAKWGWAWALKQFVFGKNKGVLVEAKVLELRERNFFEELPEPDVRHTNGLRVWILNDSNFVAAVQRTKTIQAQTIFSPRVQTAPGVQARVGMNGTSQTFSADVVAKRARKGTELATIIQSSERVGSDEPLPVNESGSFVWRTNFSFGARMRIPEGGGALVLDEGKLDEGKSKVVVISAKWQ
jgi:hypothetical protein